MSRTAGQRDVVPTPPPGSTARIEASGPLAPGAPFGVRGIGFQPDEAVEIFLASSTTGPSSELQKLGDAIAGPDGTFQRDDLTAPAAAGQYYLVARGAATGFTQFTPIIVGGELIPTRAPPETPTPGPIGPLPDLTIASVAIELETGASCAYVSTQLGIRVVVQNIGNASAGPFLVEANNQRQLAPTSTLAPGQTTSLWFPGFTTGPNLVVVDPSNMVVESSKDNNAFNGPLPVPTLPATCTPPPGPTIVVPTATPNPNPSDAWYAQYFGNVDLIPPVLFDQNLPGPPLNVNWGTGAPGPRVPRNNWSAIFTSNANFPTTDNYQFTLSVNGAARVFVDNVQIINEWVIRPPRTVTADVSLTAGTHILRVEYYKSGPSASVSLNWKVNYAGWEGRYYNSTDWTGPLVIKRDDPLALPNPPGFLNTAVMPSWPPPQVNPSSFSVDWRRSVNFPVGGTYMFTATVDDGIRLLVDGAIVAGIDDIAAGPKTLTGARVLNAGQHFLQVLYVNYTGPGNLNLVWEFVPPPPSPTPTNTSTPLPPTATPTPTPPPPPTATPTPTTPPPPSPTPTPTVPPPPSPTPTDTPTPAPATNTPTPTATPALIIIITP
ncbi:MAG: PA14 domain-containing protein [Anaerolineae bacterium]|nr:PA14 domain-containing protein [Candidatus Roseilinea sp.]MDW8451360.1 PA14 domain-containing protein [Anaerolineae bacterium]